MTPRREPWRSRLRRLQNAIARWWVNPAPEPGELNKTREGRRHHRPIGIELGFFLHADASVYWRPRDGSGERKVEHTELVAMVHQEYRGLIDRARRRQRWRQVKTAVAALRRKDLDTTKPRT